MRSGDSPPLSGDSPRNMGTVPANHSGKKPIFEPVMKKVLFFLSAILSFLAGCGNRNAHAVIKPSETLGNVKSAYSDIVPFFVQRYRNRWKEMGLIEIHTEKK